MLKNKNGLAAVDICIALIAIIIFSSIILSLMYNVKLENLKIKAKVKANIYLTEILENIGIAKYDDVTSENLNLFPNDMSDAYTAKIEVSKLSDEDSNKEDVIKKVKVIVSYEIGNKTYEESMERLKVKEL